MLNVTPDDLLRPKPIVLPQDFLPLLQPMRHKVFYGGRGGAKSTTLASVLVILSCVKTLRIVCARQFMASIRDSSKQLIEQKIIEFGLQSQFKITNYEIIHLKTKSRFTFIGLDRSIGSVKSLEGADICFVDEASALTQKAIDVLIPTIRKPNSEIWWSFNPDLATDAVFDYFITNTEDDAIVVHVGVNSNPFFYHTTLPKEMLSLKAKNYLKYRNIWLGEIDRSNVGRIYPRVRVERMQLLDGLVPLYGLDFGFSVSPCALVVLYVNVDGGWIYVAREFFAHKSHITDLGAQLLPWLKSKSDEITADSATPEYIDILNRDGFNITPATKGPHSVRAGISAVQSFDLIVDPGCTNLIEETERYIWLLDKNGNQTGEPIKNYDHGLDAVRYVVSAVLAGDLVATASSDGGVYRF